MAYVQQQPWHGGRATPKAAMRPQRRSATVKLDAKQVVAAIASLYDDELKPTGRIILKRVCERASGGDQGPTPFVDTRRLRRICERCPYLKVVEEEGDEYTALLAGRHPTFVDPADPYDPYPEDLWRALAAYFSSDGPGSELRLPGGRYACARAFVALGLPCFDGLSLGQVCHILALAVSTRRILGYCEGHILPYCRSEVGLKELCAAWQMPIHSNKSSAAALPLATWEQTRAGLWELLDRAERQGTGLIPLPNVKRLFRTEFNLELSETALGHSRVLDLLHDERLHDICVLHRQGSVHVVARAAMLPNMFTQSCPGAPWALPESMSSQDLAYAMPLPELVCTDEEGLGATLQAGAEERRFANLPAAIVGFDQMFDQISLEEWLEEKFLESPWSVPDSGCTTETSSDGSSSDSISNDDREEDDNTEGGVHPLRTGSFFAMMAQDGSADCNRSFVKNTFIHIAPANKTQRGGAARQRRASVPSSMRLNHGKFNPSATPDTSELDRCDGAVCSAHMPLERSWSDVYPFFQ